MKENGTKKIKLRNEGKGKGQGSLPSKEYRTNLKELKEEIMVCCSHMWSQT